MFGMVGPLESAQGLGVSLDYVDARDGAWSDAARFGAESPNSLRHRQHPPRPRVASTTTRASTPAVGHGRPPAVRCLRPAQNPISTAHGDGDGEVGSDVPAPPTAPLEQLDHCDDHAPRAGSAAGPGLRPDRPEPGAPGRPLGAIRQPGAPQEDVPRGRGFRALLGAAAELDAEARDDCKRLDRRAVVATLGLAGLRISGLVDLRVAQVALTRGRSSRRTPRPRRACGRSRSPSTCATSCSSTSWTGATVGCRFSPPTTPSARAAATGAIPTGSATACSLARSSGRARAEPTPPPAPSRDHTPLAAPHLGDIRGDDLAGCHRTSSGVTRAAPAVR
jgi:hypothetical protein